LTSGNTYSYPNPHFHFSASDSGSGISGYYRYWGTSSTGEANGSTTGLSTTIVRSADKMSQGFASVSFFD
jgi:hypothetical protein